MLYIFKGPYLDLKGICCTFFPKLPSAKQSIHGPEPGQVGPKVHEVELCVCCVHCMG